MQAIVRYGNRLVQSALPHDEYRTVYRTLFPTKYDGLMEWRTRPVVDEHSHSLAPYVNKKAVFVHVPKCAGISVAQSLFQCRGGTHLQVRKYRIIFSDQEWQSFFRFTFVRNPWDRLVSAYYFLKAGGINNKDKEDANQTVKKFNSFDEFVREFISTPKFSNYTHFTPQWEYLCVSKWTKPDVDFIGRFEQIATDYAYIADRLGVDAPLLDRNRVRRGGGADYRREFSDAAAEIAARAYRRDIDLFGYAF